MINVKDINIDDKLSIKFLYITFTVENMVEPEINYRFDLYKSVNQAELYTCIASEIKDFRYQDFNVNLLNPNIFSYYKVKITEKSTGETSWSKPYRYNNRVCDRWSSAIESIEETYLNDVIDNSEAIILQRKRTGSRCECWHPHREIGEETCKICYGVGFVGGYYAPVVVKINAYNSLSYAHEYKPTEDTDRASQLQVWTANFPKIETEDILIDSLNNRFLISSHSNTTKNYHIIRQILTLDEFPQTNIIYEFPIEREE